MSAQSQALILLVEDDPGVARLEQIRLERSGYIVATAATASEGLAVIGRENVDLIVLDQQLSTGTSGLDLFRQIKEAGHDIPAILVTGQEDEQLLVEALRAGVRDFVPKTPNFLNHLEPIVSRVIRQVKIERDLAESRVVAREHEVRRRELEHEVAQRKRVEQALSRRRGESSADGREHQGFRDLHHRSRRARCQLELRRRAALRLFRDGGPWAAYRRTLPPRGSRRHCTGARDRRRRGHRTAPPTSAGTSARTAAGSSPAACSLQSTTSDSNLRGFTKIARDITERKEAEEAVREAAVRLKAIVDTAVDGIITIDEDGTVESMNLAAERIFGFARQEVIGTNITMLMPEPYRSEHGEYLSAYFEHGPEADHRLGARGRRPAQGRLDLPHGAGRQRDPAGSPPNLHRNRPRHHRVQDRR